MMQDNLCKYRIVSFSALFISIISISVVIIYSVAKFPSTENLRFDYIGVIVGILSLLITVLLAWNVYSLIDLKQSKEYIDYRLSDYDHEISGGIYQAMGISKLDQKKYYEALFFFIQGIKEQNESVKHTYTENLVDFILKIKQSQQEYHISKEMSDAYIEVLESCNSKNKKEAINYIKTLTNGKAAEV